MRPNKPGALLREARKQRVKPELIHWTPIVDVGNKGRDKWALKSKMNFTSGEIDEDGKLAPEKD